MDKASQQLIVLLAALFIAAILTIIAIFYINNFGQSMAMAFMASLLIMGGLLQAQD